jgi:hypothetical protein
MRYFLLSLGGLAVIAIVLLWPPAVLNISKPRFIVVSHGASDSSDPTRTLNAEIATATATRTVAASMSDVRTFIFLVAVITFIAAVVSGVASAVLHRAS